MKTLKGLEHLYEAKRTAQRTMKRTSFQLPGGNIFDNLDTLIRSVYQWRDSDGQWAKIYECNSLDLAIDFSKILKNFFRYNGIQGSSQVFSEGRIYVQFYGGHDTHVTNMVDNLHQEICNV